MHHLEKGLFHCFSLKSRNVYVFFLMHRLCDILLLVNIALFVLVPSASVLTLNEFTTVFAILPSLAEFGLRSLLFSLNRHKLDGFDNIRIDDLRRNFEHNNAGYTRRCH